MLQMLQIGKIVQVALTLMVVLAIWRAFNGDVVAIADKAWAIVQGGSEVITRLWTQFTSSA